MRKYLFIFLTIFCFTNLYADDEVKYKTYNKLPCSFNSAKVSTSTQLSIKRTIRCSKSKGYPLKRGTSIEVKRGTPVFAITDMKLLYAKDRSAQQRSKILNNTHKKQGTDIIYDDIELKFFDKDNNQILFYHLMDTPFVPGFGKGNCERPLEFGSEKWKQLPSNCGGYSKKILDNEWWVKKGDLIGHSGTTGQNDKGDPHISFSFIMNKENLSEKEKKLCHLRVKKNFKLKKQTDCKKWSPTYCYECYVAPEISNKFKWENFPTDDPEYYLLPIINKKYYKKIGYIKK